MQPEPPTLLEFAGMLLVATHGAVRLILLTSGRPLITRRTR